MAKTPENTSASPEEKAAAAIAEARRAKTKGEKEKAYKDFVDATKGRPDGPLARILAAAAGVFN